VGVMLPHMEVVGRYVLRSGAEAWARFAHRGWSMKQNVDDPRQFAKGDDRQHQCRESLQSNIAYRS
jgi:hypothetical protein